MKNRFRLGCLAVLVALVMTATLAIPVYANSMETDHYSAVTATLNIDGFNVPFTGTATMQVAIGPSGECDDSDGDGLDDVEVELVELALAGAPSYDYLYARESPTRASVGIIEELANSTPGILDVPPFTPSGTATSFFDVFYEFGNDYGATYPFYTDTAARIQATIDQKPPDDGTTYQSNHGPIPIYFQGFQTDTLYSETVNFGVPDEPPPPPPPVPQTPSLTTWGIIVAGAALTGLMPVALRRRQAIRRS